MIFQGFFPWVFHISKVISACEASWRRVNRGTFVGRMVRTGGPVADKSEKWKYMVDIPEKWNWLVVTGTMEFYDFPYIGNKVNN
jgi:hypothetical protein